MIYGNAAIQKQYNNKGILTSNVIVDTLILLDIVDISVDDPKHCLDMPKNQTKVIGVNVFKNMTHNPSLHSGSKTIATSVNTKIRMPSKASWSSLVASI